MVKKRKKVVIEEHAPRIDRELDKIYIYKRGRLFLRPIPFYWKPNQNEINKLKALVEGVFNN
jgi:hypothetical protein